MLLICATMLAACGGGGGGGSAPAPSSGTSTTFILNSDTSSVNFGKVVVGDSVSSTVRLTNAGNSRLTLSYSTIGSPFTLSGTCAELAPNDSCTLTTGFSPTAQGTFSTSLNITSRAATRSVSFSGEGQGLDVQILSVANSCLNPIVSRVAVSDSDGAPITNLAANQFTTRLANTGSPLALVGISSFQPLTTQSATAVGLILDYSVSLEDNRQDVVDASRVFIENLRDIDRAGVFKFAQRLDNNRQNFTTADSAGRATLAEALTRPTDVGNPGISDVWGATNAVVDLLRQETTPNRIAVLITDGRQNTTTIALSDLIATASRQNIAVFVVAYGDIQLDGLQQLANGTGGRVFVTQETSNLTAVYDAIQDQLSNQYEIRVVNASPGPEKSLQIAVSNNGATGDDTKKVLACP